jgi:pimeloyl-ACP methyl ester carboxylesterase
MATKIFVHGSGHKATSWEKTISYMTNNEDIVCPNLSSILEGKEASYENLYSSFVKYCNEFDGQIHLCGLSLGGILALNFALDFPQKVKTLVLIGTPYKVPKVAFSFQNRNIFSDYSLLSAVISMV